MNARRNKKMPESFVEELQLNTKEGRKRFYEQLAAHKKELFDSYHVNLPDYEQWEKDCETKMALAEKARERKRKHDQVSAKFSHVKEGQARIFGYLLQIDGEDADKNNQEIADTLLTNRKKYADLVAEKLLAIDVKKEQENMKGKSDLELADMYLKNPEKYDLAWVVNDLLTHYSDVLDENLRKKVKENELDLQDLFNYSASIKPLENELYCFLPLPEIESLDQFKMSNVKLDFGETKASTPINNFFITAGMNQLRKLMEIDDAYKASVGEKIDDLLAACKDSEEKSGAHSKEYDKMKDALENYKANYKNDDKSKKSKENLKKAANGYLAYKASKSMSQKAHGAVAAAGGILELIDEIDAHKPSDEKDIKPFIKHSEAEGIYEQKANEVFGKAKDDLSVSNELMKNGAMKDNLDSIIGAIEESGNSSHRDSDLSGKMYQQLIAIRNKNAEGTDITYDEMSELKKTATEYLSYKNQKGYNKNALGKIAAADGILSFVEAYENKDTNILKNISTEKNAVDKIMGAVKADKSVAKVYKEKKEKVSYNSLLKDEIKENSAKESKKTQSKAKKEKTQDMSKAK